MIIAVDFDGTCVTHEFPEVGKDIGAVPVLRRLADEGHPLILWTMRSHPKKSLVADRPNQGLVYRDNLQEAIDWFAENGIGLLAVNNNPDQKEWTESPKAYAQLYIDDAALGCPLIYPENGRPYVDWEKVLVYLVKEGIIPPKLEDLPILVKHEKGAR